MSDEKPNEAGSGSNANRSTSNDIPRRASQTEAIDRWLEDAPPWCPQRLEMANNAGQDAKEIQEAQNAQELPNGCDAPEATESPEGPAAQEPETAADIDYDDASSMEATQGSGEESGA